MHLGSRYASTVAVEAVEDGVVSPVPPVPRPETAPMRLCKRVVDVVVPLLAGAVLMRVVHAALQGRQTVDTSQHLAVDTSQHLASTLDTSQHIKDTCLPASTPDKLSIEWIGQHKCGEQYDQNWDLDGHGRDVVQPAYHLWSQCAQGGKDKLLSARATTAAPVEDMELRLSLANFAFHSCETFCVYSILGPEDKWWQWRPAQVCWELWGGTTCQIKINEIEHAVTIKQALCSVALPVGSLTPSPSVDPSHSFKPFYDPAWRAHRRIHLTITGRLDCLGETSYRHLERLVEGLQAEGHQVFIYTVVSYADPSEQKPSWDRLRVGWGITETTSETCMNIKEPLHLQHDATFSQSSKKFIRAAGAGPQYEACLRLFKSVRWCNSLLSNLVKLKMVHEQIKLCLTPEDIIIRTRPSLMMRCHEYDNTAVEAVTGEYAWGSCWPLIPLLGKNTVALSKHYNYGPGLDDNFAIMTPASAETYYTLLDRIESVMDKGKVGSNPQKLFGINMRENEQLQVVEHDWVYDLQGKTNWFDNGQFCSE